MSTRACACSAGKVILNVLVGCLAMLPVVSRGGMLLQGEGEIGPESVPPVLERAALPSGAARGVSRL